VTGRRTARGPVPVRRLEEVFRAGGPVLELRVFGDAEELAAAAAEEFVGRARHAVARRARFTVALPGGATPSRFFELLADKRRGVPWRKVHVFWGDERLVPPGHTESNFRRAQDLLLAKVPIPQANVHRIVTEGHEPEAVAALYESELRTFFRVPAGRFPRFDLVFLGLGAEGHTASLFPGSQALEERARLVAAPLIAKLGTYRITLTLPVLNAARAVVFLVSGAQKAEALAHALEGPKGGEGTPARLIRPRAGTLLWLVDRAAASRLHERTPASA
jgi:6-phosphogluconolactonase